MEMKNLKDLAILGKKEAKKVIVLLRDVDDDMTSLYGGISLERYIQKDFKIKNNVGERSYNCICDININDIADCDYDIIADRIDVCEFFVYENEEYIFVCDYYTPDELIKKNITQENIQKFF